MARVYIPPGFTLYQADQPLAQIEIPNASVTLAKLGSDIDATGIGFDADKVDGQEASEFVEMTGDETIAGVKTFSSIPVLPASDPTTANQATRKSYVDSTTTTKEIWVPFTGGTESYQVGYATGYRIDASAEIACCELRIPADFTTLTSIEVGFRVLALNQGEQTVDIAAQASGEAEETHTGTTTNLTVSPAAAGSYYEEDISAAMPAGVAAGDNLSIKITFYADTNALFKGIRIKYT